MSLWNEYEKNYWKVLVAIRDAISFYDFNLNIIIHDLDSDHWLPSLLPILYFLHQI